MVQHSIQMAKARSLATEAMKGRLDSCQEVQKAYSEKTIYLGYPTSAAGWPGLTKLAADV
jgi:hypothetical protein